ncbi:hypothetical protein KGM_215912 [Danaus plexippus plexippus]|uniref:Uncharacterized protein n=1 Tax=Danaus plexippus plexippus TaxID=278856 RepID=A0A212EXC1_DANPL|nr:hypothetical protein KGM_215912 [Danaus plexippus plexippus]
MKNQEYLGSGSDRGKIDEDKEIEFTEAENRIIQDVYSPDYYEPHIILDYRYLKTGGRGYARSDGGQVLILPRRNHMPSPHNNYDTLLEYLRLKHLKEISKPYHPNSRINKNYREILIEDRNYDMNKYMENPHRYNRKMSRHDAEENFKSDAELGSFLLKREH